MEIKIENLSLGFDEILFDKLNLTIHSNTFTTILGKNGCGKTSLIKALIGEEEYSGTIKYNKVILDNDNKNELLKDVQVFFNNAFIFDNVYDELVFSLEKIDFIGNIDEQINKVSKELNLEYLIHKNINELNDKDKSLSMLLIMLVSNPKVLILDGIFNNIDNNIKEKIVKYFKKQKLTVLNITNNVEDILLSDEVVLINKKKCICIKDILKLLDKESEFNESNLKLPFMIDLSNKLKFYDLIDKVILDEDELVDSIWK